MRQRASSLSSVVADDIVYDILGRWSAGVTVGHGLFHKHRMLAEVCGDHTEVVKLLLPLIIGEPAVDHFVDAFVDVMDEAHSGGG